jgi:hypothetical protein
LIVVLVVLIAYAFCACSACVFLAHPGGLAAVRTTERSVEGRMSQIRRVFKHGPCSGPQTVNHTLRFPELVRRMARHPEVAPLSIHSTFIIAAYTSFQLYLSLSPSLYLCICTWMPSQDICFVRRVFHDICMMILMSAPT